MEQLNEYKDVTIRPASLNDLDAVIDLASEMIIYSISPLRDIPIELVKNYRKQDLTMLHQVFGSPNLGVFIAEDKKGEFIGHIIIVAHIHDSLTGEVQAMIVDLSVKERYWGTTVASLLCAKAEEFARENGMYFLELGVTSINKRAVRFYEKMGFAEERKRMIKRI